MPGDGTRPIRAVRPAHEEDWESRLRPTPTAAAVRSTLASEGVEGVLARWGGRYPGKLIAAANRAARRSPPAGRAPTLQG